MITLQTYSELGCPKNYVLVGAVCFEMLNDGKTYEGFFENDVKAEFEKRYGKNALLVATKIRVDYWGHPNNPERDWRISGDLYRQQEH